ncbi:MAG TPA: ABC transporter substrate-binding protein [Acidimicrobiales bacterium]|nr:ABC transporter substrate-binding protein [Acidimicrobiales bacterium]
MAGWGARRLRRWWRRLRRGPAWARALVVAVPVLLVVGLVVGLSGSSGPGVRVATSTPTTATTTPAAPTPPDRASTSSAGVTAHTITVAFPESNLDALGSKLGFAGDVEFSEQTKAIKLFVGAINDAGGIDGRKIKPVITTIDPTNEISMRALCKQWTEGSNPVFAVLDGVGTWNGDNQLCITQEGHTPLLSQWTTVTNWTDLGSPYLWWTGPDDAAILQATVDWGVSAGTLGAGRKVAVVAGDRASDQLALNQYLLPDLARAGVKPLVETLAADPSDVATTDAQAPLVVQRLHAAGIQSVIPLVPFNAFFPVLAAETSQKYFPTLLLSDYENAIQSALGLLPFPYGRALDGQEGLTTETLGGVDDWRPESQGGYDPGVRSCFTLWHKVYPQIPPGNQNFFLEEQGPVQAWCQEIRLFATAATLAGPHLDRRTFVEAMARVSDFPGGFSPVLSYGPDKFSGPTEYRIVRLHTNSPPSTQCKMPLDGIPQQVCWVVVQDWQPLPGAGSSTSSTTTVPPTTTTTAATDPESTAAPGG